MKLHRRYYNLTLATLMSGLMSLIIALVLTLLNEGLGASFVPVWLRGFFASWATSLPVAVFVLPLVRRLIEPLFADIPAPQR